jgi:HK97 gp10 family phage protein
MAHMAAKGRGLIAELQIKMPDDFLLKLSQLGAKTDEIAERVLEAGGRVVLDKVRSNLEAVIGRDIKGEPRSTGELVSALGLSPAKVNRKGGHDIKVGVAEPRSDGGSNAKIANVIEYGKHGQPAKPFLKPATTASKQNCEAAMRAALEEEINNL